MFHYIFFFSSRRRHTRSLCDWSSDVCSSDLLSRHREWYDADARDKRGHDDNQLVSNHGYEGVNPSGDEPMKQRSEERRVGKEDRISWWRTKYKKRKKNCIACKYYDSKSYETV